MRGWNSNLTTGPTGKRGRRRIMRVYTCLGRGNSRQRVQSFGHVVARAAFSARLEESKVHRQGSLAPEGLYAD